MLLCQFTVYGEARPAGALKIGSRKDGGHYLFHRDAKNLSEWKTAIALSAGEEFDGPTRSGPIGLEADFYVARPRGHYGKRGLLPSAPMYPVKRSAGDIDKLTRGLLDALTGIVFHDDSQVVRIDIAKHFANDDPVRLEVIVTDVDQTADLALALTAETP